MIQEEFYKFSWTPPSLCAFVYCEVKRRWIRVSPNIDDNISHCIILELVLNSATVIVRQWKALSVYFSQVGAEVGHQLPVGEEHHL